MNNEGSGNVAGVEFENRARTQSRQSRQSRQFYVQFKLILVNFKSNSIPSPHWGLTWDSIAPARTQFLKHLPCVQGRNSQSK